MTRNTEASPVTSNPPLCPLFSQEPIPCQECPEGLLTDPGSPAFQQLKGGSVEHQGEATAGGAKRRQELPGEGVVEGDSEEDGEIDEEWSEDWWCPREEAGERPQLRRVAAGPVSTHFPEG